MLWQADKIQLAFFRAFPRGLSIIMSGMIISPLSDDELILACRQGDDMAWESLLNRYERLPYSVALRYGLSAEDAADITQLTFTILLQNLDQLRPDTRLGAWLVTVAKRHIWRLLSGKRRELLGEAEDVAQSEWLGELRDDVAHWERLDWLKNGFSHLDERCRKLLYALYFEASDPSYVEIANRFNMRVGSIGPTRARCLEQLKKLMNGGK